MTARASLLSLAVLLLGTFSLLLAGCGSSGEGSPNAESPNAERAADRVSPARQTAYRIRTGFDAGLNADSGWAAGIDQPATVSVEQPFRLRFEVETPADAPFVERFRLQYRHNDGDWRPVLVGDFPYPAGATPRVSVVAAPSYADRDETTDLLDRSTAAFAGGAGVSLSGRTLSLAEAGVQSEWEWPVVLRRFADGAVTNDDGDRFEFRMVDAQGRPLAADDSPVVTATVPPRLLGGTYPETPGRIGPWETSDGSLYFLMEPAETYNVLMTVKSDDGGDTWREVDGANRPVTGDLEGFASAFHDGTIHMLHQIDEGVLHHSFRTTDTSTDGSGETDAWAVRDDTIATPGAPPVQVTALAARPDGSLVAVYGGPSDLHYTTRSPEGTWGEEQSLSSETGDVLSGPQAVTGSDGAVHLAYTRRDGTAWYRQIQPDGSLTPPQQVADGLGTAETDVGTVLPLVHLAETNTTVIIYRTNAGTLQARRVQDGTLSDPVQVTDRPVVQNPVDSDQVGADAVAIGSTVHVLFVEDGTGRLYHTQSGTDRAWTPETLQVDGADVQWVRGQPITRGSSSPVAYGYVYDGGSNGGSGKNVYAEVPLE
jgi:hypothetical protein